MAGSIRKLKNRPHRPWRARYRGPDGRERSKTFRRRVEAEAWLRAELTQLDLGAWVDPSAGKVNLSEWSGHWISALDIKPKTRAGYESLLRSRVLPTFGGVELRRITPAAVRTWVAEMSEEGLSAARIRQARQVLHAALEQAVDDGIIARNPCDRVRAPTVRRRRQRFLTAGQVEVLAAAADSRQEGTGALIRFLAYSGLRWGEAVALRRFAIDVDQRRVRIRDSATEVHGKLVLGAPKDWEQRTVIVPRFVLDRLPMDGFHEALVFTAPRGGPLRTSNFRQRVWQPALKSAADVPDDLLPHDLRDTAASLMIASGASIMAVARALGHASPKMTLDTYAGLFEDDLEDLADRMEARYGGSVAAPTRHR